MPKLIQLESLPNQDLTIRLSDQRYEISIKSISSDLMSISIKRDGNSLIQNVRAMPFMRILPKYLERGFGNFSFITVNDEYPNYQKFGGDHQLHYYAPGEV